MSVPVASLACLCFGMCFWPTARSAQLFPLHSRGAVASSRPVSSVAIVLRAPSSLLQFSSVCLHTGCPPGCGLISSFTAKCPVYKSCVYPVRLRVLTRPCVPCESATCPVQVYMEFLHPIGRQFGERRLSGRADSADMEHECEPWAFSGQCRLGSLCTEPLHVGYIQA